MKLTPKNMNKVINTPAVKTLVNAWLLADASYKVINALEQDVYAELLREIPLWADCKHGDGKRITEVKDMYLSVDEASCMKIYERATAEFIAQNLLPANVEVSTSPSHESWQLRHDTAREIVRLTGTPFGVTSEKLYCSADGVANHNEWVNLTVKAIMCLPDFVAPQLKASK